MGASRVVMKLSSRALANERHVEVFEAHNAARRIQRAGHNYRRRWWGPAALAFKGNVKCSTDGALELIEWRLLLVVSILNFWTGRIGSRTPRGG